MKRSRALAVALALLFGGARAEAAPAPKVVPTPDGDISLPAGWNVQPNPNGPLTLGPGKDDSQGVLQFSRLPANAIELARGGLLGFVRNMTKQLGWGEPSAARQGPCATGTYAFVATSGEHKAQLMWMTMSRDAVYLWTWIGDDQKSKYIALADGVVRSAKLSTRSHRAGEMSFVLPTGWQPLPDKDGRTLFGPGPDETRGALEVMPFEAKSAEVVRRQGLRRATIAAFSDSGYELGASKEGSGSVGKYVRFAATTKLDEKKHRIIWATDADGVFYLWVWASASPPTAKTLAAVEHMILAAKRAP